VKPWNNHSDEVLNRKLREVAEVGELLDHFETAIKRAAASDDETEETKAEVEKTCTYAMERQSFDIVVRTCWTRRVVHPPLYSRVFPARRRIERRFSTTRRLRLTTKT
jgi:hypothetical protein